MFVRDWMTEEVEVARPDDRVATVQERLHRRGVRQFPVVSEGRLVGIITDRNVRSEHNPRAKVATVMTPAPVTTTRGTLVEEAAELLRLRKIGALPVVEGERLVGIVSESDLLAALVELCKQLQPTTEIELLCDEGVKALERIRAVIEGNYGRILNLSGVPESNRQQLITLWVRMPVGHLPEQLLEEAGFRVLACITGLDFTGPKGERQGSFPLDQPGAGTWNDSRP